jgi:hypothetical protein
VIEFGVAGGSGEEGALTSTSNVPPFAVTVGGEDGETMGTAGPCGSDPAEDGPSPLAGLTLGAGLVANRGSVRPSGGDTSTCLAGSPRSNRPVRLGISGSSPWPATASAGWTASAVAAQARSNTALPRTQPRSRPFDAIRSTALLLPLEETRLRQLVG